MRLFGRKTFVSILPCSTAPPEGTFESAVANSLAREIRIDAEMLADVFE